METLPSQSITVAKELTLALGSQIKGGLKKTVGAAAIGISAAIGIGVVLGLSYAIAEGGRSRY